MPQLCQAADALQFGLQVATVDVLSKASKECAYMAAGISPVVERRVFRIFISYASEDWPIATAVASCFKPALPDFFAEVNLDKDFLEPGSAFQAQIEAKLQATDVLVIVYTDTEKRSHSFTGWEVGY